MGVLSFLFYGVLVAFVVFAADSLVVAFVHRRALGRFEIVAEWGRMLVFRSAAGTFSLREDLQTMEYPVAGSRRAVRFQDIEALEFRVDQEDAVLGEFLLDPFMDECWPAEQDRIDRYLISAILRTGERIAMFRSGRYRRRKYLHDLYTEVQLTILESVGMLVDVEAQSRAALERIGSRMGRPRVVYPTDRPPAASRGGR